MERASDEAATTSDLRNVGTPWSDTENAALVQELRDGHDLDDIAEIHGRTLGAIQARINSMVPDEEDLPTSRQARIAWLREQLTAGEYDWQTPLQARTSKYAWRAAEDDQLRKGWELATPLTELSGDLLRSEPMLVRRFIQLRIAKSLGDVIDRLGCDPEGPLALRDAIARGAAGPVIHVLVGVDEVGRLGHVSIHESAHAARGLQNAILKQRTDVTTWHTVEREVGGPGYAEPLIGFDVKPHSPQ